MQFSSSGVTSKNSTAESSPLLRADSTLTYVPGLGTNGQGVLVSIGGGNANQMMDNSILDVYDIGARGWTKQATQGEGNCVASHRCTCLSWTVADPAPQAIRLGRECLTVLYAVRQRSTASCSTRSSSTEVRRHNKLEYLGKPEDTNLIDVAHTLAGQASNRTTQILSGQNSDLYILSLPSFTWTFVGSNLPSQPTGRAAHCESNFHWRRMSGGFLRPPIAFAACTLLGSQMVVVGGYISEDLM